MIPLRYNVRSLLVRRSTTVATAFGIALVVFVLAAAQMLVRGIRNTLSKSGRPEHALVMRKGAASELRSNFDGALVNLVLTAPGVRRDASGTPRGAGEVLTVIALEKPGAEAQIVNATLRGIPEQSYGLRDDLRIIAGRKPRPGADEAIIGKRLDGKLKGLAIGQSFELKKDRKVAVVGVFAADGSSYESEILCDLDLVRSSFGRGNLISSVTVELTSPEAFTAFQRAIEHDKRLELEALPEPTYYENQSEGTAGLVSFLGGAITFFFALGATIGAAITMYTAVANRKHEIGTLRALGFSPFTVLSSFLVEAVALALVGGAGGTLAALPMKFVHFSMLNMNSWSDITFSFDPEPEILLISMAVAGVIGVLGGFLPAMRAARMSPLQAMRD